MTASDDELDRRAAGVRLVLTDVDGVLSDGRLFLGPDGHDVRAFSARDGLGIRLGQRAGLAFGIVSGRRARVVVERASELDFEEVHQGVGDKRARLEEILARRDVPAQACCFIGDDINDLPALRRVGLAAAPADAAAEVVQAAHLVTRAAGGHGVVREVVELILRASDRWDRAIEPYLR